MLTFEEGRDRLPFVDWPWIDDMRIGDPAWCYVEGQHYKSAREVIHGLIDRVARGGGLVLNLSPKSDGTFPQAQIDVLHEIGEWLEVNGEAIYGTRPWKIQSEGGTQKLIGRKWHFDGLDASDIRFTRSKDGRHLYAIALGWPENGRLTIATLGRQTRISEGGIRRIVLLNGQEEELEWTRDAESLRVALPETSDRESPAWAIRIEPHGALDLE
jgi:alpha-L-fucosidase